MQFNCLSLKCLKEDRRDLVLTGGGKVVQVARFLYICTATGIAQLVESLKIEQIVHTYQQIDNLQ